MIKKKKKVFEGVTRRGALFVPPLRFENVTEHIIDLLNNSDPSDWFGIAVTSYRAIEAFCVALSQLSPQVQSRWKDALRARDGLKRVLMFGIGQKTKKTIAERIREEGLDAEGSSASELAEAIISSLDRLDPEQTQRRLPVLFLCGSKALPDLPQRLQQASITVNPVVVYTSCESSEPIEPPEELVQELDLPVDHVVNEVVSRQWIVFFSPSGLQALSRSTGWWRRFRVAAIGKTTAAALKSNGIFVEAIAASPNAPSLLQALLSAT